MLTIFLNHCLFVLFYTFPLFSADPNRILLLLSYFDQLFFFENTFDVRQMLILNKWKRDDQSFDMFLSQSHRYINLKLPVHF